MDKKNHFSWLGIAIAGIILTLPALIYGFPVHNHDGWVHTLWYSNFASQLWAGELYPRWLLGLNRGLGSPALFFYQPGPYFATSLFKPFFPGDAHGLRQLGASATLALIASGWFAYLWLCRIVPRKPALIASLVYLVMPYHLAIDLYLRGAFTEFWAFVWLPLILFLAHRLRSGERFSVAGLALSYALLIVSHLPTALIFSPVPILYVIIPAEKGSRIRSTGRVVAALTLGIGLAAIYLLPAWTMREFVSMQEMSRPELYFENWFVLTSLFARGLPTYLSWMVISMSCAAGSAYFAAGKQPNEMVRRERAFWAAVVVGAVVMMTPLSKPVWKLLPVLQTVQFPFRFNTILCVASAALIAFAMASPRQTTSPRSAALRWVIALPVTVWMLIYPVSVWREYIVHPVTRANLEELIENNQDAPEYRPRWAERDAFYRLLGELGKATQFDQVSVIEGSADVTVERWLPRSIGLRVSSATGATLRIKQLYFPGWRARVEDGSDLETRAATNGGLLDVIAPEGDHRVKIELTPGWAERWGQYVSAISAIIALALIARSVVLSRAFARSLIE
ncbi:MAG: 6-pyruvoyl-tetrahydropterin synthase-related protein [Acidobacteriota bacterium]